MTTPDATPPLDPNDPHIPDEDKIPEAPQPSPHREIFMQVTENHAANIQDGGMLIFSVMPRQHEDIIDARLVISAKRDDLLHQYPWKYQSTKQNRFYRVTIDEIDVSLIPPRPEDPARQHAAEVLAAIPVPGPEPVPPPPPMHSTPNESSGT